LCFSIALYFVTGVFWLPVVWIQMQLRDSATGPAAQGKQLPLLRAVSHLVRIWLSVIWGGDDHLMADDFAPPIASPLAGQTH
jgi:uncharacterized membrane protein